MQGRTLRGIRASLREIESLKGRLFLNTPMSRYTTMGVGGNASFFYQPDSLASLADCIRLCRRKRIYLLAIGNGSNIIISDRGVKGVVVKLSSPFFKGIEVCRNDITCGGGLSLNELCHFAEENSLGGCEFLMGIPGTVGGAIIQNAGAYSNSISDILKDVRCLDKKGRVRILNRNEVKFEYRKSSLEGYVIAGATFHLRNKNRKAISKKISSCIERRLISQDYNSRSAGCIFKNPKASDLSAAELIDRCGLKGSTIGGASVSERHANFIINKNDADASDILRLIALIKKKVRLNFGIELEEEVKIIK